jgi:uncharacterized protein YndB with AHSA1/START domain
VTATFAESNARTTLELVFAFSSPEVAAKMAKFIKQAGGEATWDRLAEHLAEAAGGAPSFVINRAFDAPVARVFERWTRAEHLARWLAPTGSTTRFLRSEIAPGASTLFEIAGPHGSMRVRAEYLAIEPSERVVYAQQFVDEHERPAGAPGAERWPAMLRNTVLFTAEGPDRTRVTLTTEPHGAATAEELASFTGERAGMTLGWSGSFDALDALLELHPAV